jgi:hypothetical protein
MLPSYGLITSAPEVVVRCKVLNTTVAVGSLAAVALQVSNPDGFPADVTSTQY